jgi:hypothetical protein
VRLLHRQGNVSSVHTTHASLDRIPYKPTGVSSDHEKNKTLMTQAYASLPRGNWPRNMRHSRFTVVLFIMHLREVQGIPITPVGERGSIRARSQAEVEMRTF